MKLTIDIQDEILGKFERVAKIRGLSVEENILEYVTLSAQHLIAIPLPISATVQTMLMHRHDGRDQIANAAMSRWTEFERPMPQYLFACAQRWPGLIVDVGANSGFYGLLAATADCNNQILAFEPDPPVYEALRQNVDANALQDRITATLLALSSRAGIAALFVPSQEHGFVETSSSLEGDFKTSHSEVRQVTTDTLDHFLATSIHASTPVTLIKIDVEGHEASVLMGAHETVAHCRPILFVEVLARADLAMLSGFIAQHGYVDVPLHPDGVLTAQGSVRFDPSAWNHVFLPPEKLVEFFQFSRML